MASRLQPTTAWGAVPDSAVQEAFKACSWEARDTLEVLKARNLDTAALVDRGAASVLARLPRRRRHTERTVHKAPTLHLITPLQLTPGEHLPREDVPEVLRRAARLPTLGGPDAAAVLRAYRLDAAGLIDAAEFTSSWRALQRLTAAPSTGATGAGAAAQRRPGATSAAPRQAPALSSQVRWLLVLWGLRASDSRPVLHPPLPSSAANPSPNLAPPRLSPATLSR